MIYKIKPWDHQLEAISRAETMPYFALFFEAGAGKTSTCINIIRHKINSHRRLLRTLIFCPPVVMKNWRKEWFEHSNVEPEQITCLAGTAKQRLKTFKEKAFVGEEPRGHIFITNYESLNMKELFEAFKKWELEVFVADECHRIRNYKSQRSKLAEELVNGRMRRVGGKYGKLEGPRPYVYLLSGSPVLNTAMDLFQQYKILDAGATFSDSFFAFRNYYFRDRNAGMPTQRYFPNWQPADGSIEKISEKIAPTSMRVLKKDCMSLPPLVRQTILVPMSAEQRRIYESMRRDFVAFLSDDGVDHVVSATLAITKGLRMMQIASGYIKTVDEQELDIGDGFNEKQQALYELLEDLTPNSKVLVWAVWKRNYEQIKAVLEKLGVKYVECHGDVSTKQKEENIRAFNEDENIRVYIGHPASGGIGVNLVSSDVSIFYSRNFSLENDIQAEARNYRGGSERHQKVTRIDLVTEGSIEEDVVESLKNKEEVGTELLKKIIRK